MRSRSISEANSFLNVWEMLLFRKMDFAIDASFLLRSERRNQRSDSAFDFPYHAQNNWLVKDLTMVVADVFRILYKQMLTTCGLHGQPIFISSIPFDRLYCLYNLLRQKYNLKKNQFSQWRLRWIH
jgi:hypothetical protein